MGNLAPVIRMVVQRSIGHGRLFIAMAIGAVLCSALLSSVVLYSDAVRDLGLKHALGAQDRFATDLHISSTSQKFSGKDWANLDQVTREMVNAHTTGYRKDIVHYGRSATFFAAAPGGTPPAAEDRPRAHFQFGDRLQDQVRIVEGTWPATAAPATPDAPPVVEVAIGTDAAKENSITLGDEFDLFPHWRQVKPVRVKVTAIIEPIDLSADYWFGKTDRFQLSGNSWPTMPFFTDQATVIGALGGYLVDMDGSLDTFIFTDTSKIKSNNASEVEARVGALRNDARSRLTITSVDTDLDTTIKDYRDKLFFTRLPLFALMIQVAGIVLFYLVMVSTMVVERQSGEIALLKSRGAGTRQIMSVFFIEGLGIAILASVIGPIVAYFGIALLGLTPPFEELSSGELLEVHLSPLAFAFALLGAALALGALLWPAYRACRYSITNYKQQISRPPAQSAFLRYYLDLALVGLGAIALYQLRQRGSFVSEGVLGERSADPVLLATPSLFMLMVALVFLRLFPLALRLVLWMAKPLRGATIPLALTRMARAPLQHSRLILLLLLATAVGMFAAGFRSTLERGYEDRAAYKAGVEAQLIDIRNPLGVPEAALVSRVGALTGGATVSPVLRVTNASYQVQRFSGETLVTLGLKADELKGKVFFRDDFAGKSLDGLLESTQLAPAELPQGAEVPANARFLGMWVLTPLPQNIVVMGVRLRDRDGSAWDYFMGTEAGNNVVPPPDTWQFFVLDLQRPLGTRPQGVDPNPGARGWRVEGFFIRLPGSPPQVAQTLSVFFDDFQSTSAQSLDAGWGKRGFTDGQVIETFDDLEKYELSKGVQFQADPGSVTRAIGGAGRTGAVARMTFIRGRGGATQIGFRTRADSRPLPVVVDREFLDRNRKKVGDELVVYLNSQYTTVKVVGSFKYFPGYDPERARTAREGLMLTDLGALQRAGTRFPGAGLGLQPNEIWITKLGTQALDREELKKRGLQVETINERSRILAEQAEDPLVAASWEGILFLAFVGVLLVSTLGFVTYAGLGAQARSLEFAILRTMGLSGKQILGVVTFEQLFVVVAGVAAGTLLGFPLSRLMIGYMGLTEQGRAPLPPLESVVNWQSVLTVYAFLGVVVVATVATLVALYSRLAVSRALRMGEL